MKSISIDYIMYNNTIYTLYIHIARMSRGHLCNMIKSSKIQKL